MCIFLVLFVSTLAKWLAGKTYSPDIFHVIGFSLQRPDWRVIYCNGLSYVFSTRNIVNFLINFTFLTATYLSKARYSLFALKVPLNPNQSISLALNFYQYWIIIFPRILVFSTDRDMYDLYADSAQAEDSVQRKSTGGGTRRLGDWLEGPSGVDLGSNNDRTDCTGHLQLTGCRHKVCQWTRIFLLCCCGVFLRRKTWKCQGIRQRSGDGGIMEKALSLGKVGAFFVAWVIWLLHLGSVLVTELWSS